MRKQHFLTVLSAALFFAPTLKAETAGQWLTNLQPSPGVIQELGKFGGLPASYTQNLPMVLKSRMISEMDRATSGDLQSQSCHEQLNVNFLDRVTDSSANDARIANFESQFIRIEMKSCLPNLQASRVAQVYLSPEYQRSAFDTVVAHQQQGNRVCQTTETFGLGRSEYCYDNSVMDYGNGVFIHSYNDWNQNNVAAPVFYREMLTSSLQLPSGTIFYTLVYVRGVDLNPLFKSLAKSKIKSSQQKAIQLLSSMARGQ